MLSVSLQITHDALNAPLHILRAMYELQMKRTDSFFLEVQKRCVCVCVCVCVRYSLIETNFVVLMSQKKQSCINCNPIGYTLYQIQRITPHGPLAVNSVCAIKTTPVFVHSFGSVHGKQP